MINRTKREILLCSSRDYYDKANERYLLAYFKGKSGHIFIENGELKCSKLPTGCGLISKAD